MKKRIEQLLNEEFEYEPSPMRISQARIHAVLRKGAAFRGEFTVESEDQKKMKGFIYSSSPRMGYEPSDFDGIREKIIYELDSTGMNEGDVLEGAFTICSNRGEYQVPYHIEIAKSVVKTSTEVIDSLDDFIKIAKEDFQKAYSIFLSDGFLKILSGQAPRWMPLYEGLQMKPSGCQDMEEFLIGIHSKERVKFSLGESKVCLDSSDQVQQESLTILKDSWGFQKLDISSDADFIQPERQSVTTDDFIGSSCCLNYLICPEKLHAGNNYGRIRIKSSFQTLVCEITVVKSSHNASSLERREQKKRIKSLLERYLAFRLNRISLKEWVEVSQEDLDEYRRAGGAELMVELYRAHLCFASGREEDGCILLSELQGHREIAAIPELQGYYLYLTTFYNKDRKYVDYVEERLLELLGQNQENWILQWFLMYLQENLVSHLTERLEVIRRQFLCGCRSRIMYLEAYKIIEKSPLLLKKFGEFERCLLRFISREELLNNEIIMQVGDLASRNREYSGELYEILKKCYQIKPSDGLAGAICRLLIKGNKEGGEYFEWYEKAVEADLRITGLYEYYVKSLDPESKVELPRMVRMYFAYNNTLDYRKKAQVYANVIENREKDPRTFQNYRPIIEKFMVDQIAAGRINRELAVIYRTFLNRSVLNERMAKQLAAVLFSCEIHSDDPNAKFAVVIHRQLKGEQRVSLTGKKAVVQIYTDDYEILIEDEKGYRYPSLQPVEMVRLLDEPELISLCRELAPKCPEIILYVCRTMDEKHPVREENVKDFCSLLDMKEIRESFREKIRQEILDYYYHNPKSESLYDFLHEIEPGQFVLIGKRKLTELLVSEGMSREAFELTEVYGAEDVDCGVLVRMCSRMIISKEFDEDEMLLSNCWHCFVNDKYDETVLSYLVKYYDGPIENMKRLWRAGKQFELETFELEEKILLVLVFMRCKAGQTEEIFASYRRKMGKKKLLKAYAISRAYDYFVREETIGDQVFTYIEQAYEREKIQPRVCLLALLRWYAASASLTEKQQENVQKLLEEFYYGGMQFAFYQKFDRILTRPFQIQDKSYVEYRTNPGATVTLTWYLEKSDGEKTREISEPMKNVYEGIFVKEFTLFYGETVHYSIQEEQNGTRKEKNDQTLSFCSNSSTGDHSCYDLINRLAKALDDRDEKAVKHVMELYLEQKCLADHIFPCNE